MTASAYYPIWVSENYFIPVDQDGYVVGFCPQGVFGFIIRLKTRQATSKDGRTKYEFVDSARALKIPRLLADSARENGFIADMLRKEHDEVDQILRDDNSRLLQAFTRDLPTLLTGERVKYRGQREAAEQQGSAIFVSFEKGKNPRFALVKCDTDRIQVRPEGVKSSILKALAAPIKTFGAEKFFAKVCQGPIRPEPLRLDLGLRCGESKAGDTHLSKFDLVSWDSPEPETPSADTLQVQKAVWDELSTAPSSDVEQGCFSVLRFVSVDPGIERAKSGYELAKTNEMGQEAVSWYTGVPSIPFAWSCGTLEQTLFQVAQGDLDWNLSAILEVGVNLLRGIETLHNQGRLHADVRPANIMSVEISENRQVPSSYVVGDYGSFSRGIGNFESATPSESTLVGPIIGRQRVSPFYAPERRLAKERESADRAVIVPLIAQSGTDVDRYFVLLGWKSNVIDLASPANDTITPILKQLLLPETQAQHTSSQQVSGSNPPLFGSELRAIKLTVAGATIMVELLTGHEDLTAGDRLRIEDLVFNVRKAARLTITSREPAGGETRSSEPLLLVECDGRFARVIQERLSVYLFRDHLGVVRTATENGELLRANYKIVSISRYIEFRKWSAATDIYSAGAVILYAWFCCGWRRKRLASTEAHAKAVAKHGDYEDAFSALIEELEKPHYFRHVWQALNGFAKDFQETAGKPASSNSNIAPAGLETLARKADRVMKHVNFAPHLDYLLAGSEENGAVFLLMLHFTMACLHRQNQLDQPDKPASDKTAELPFCRTRLDDVTVVYPLNPNQTSATAQVNLITHCRTYLERQIREHVGQGPILPYLGKLSSHAGWNRELLGAFDAMSLDGFDPERMLRLSLDNDRLIEEVQQQQVTLEMLRKKFETLESQLHTSDQRVKELTQERDQTGTQLDELSEYRGVVENWIEVRSLRKQDVRECFNDRAEIYDYVRQLVTRLKAASRGAESKSSPERGA